MILKICLTKRRKKMAAKKVKVEVENINGETEQMELSEKATQRVEIKKIPTEKARIKIG